MAEATSIEGASAIDANSNTIGYTAFNPAQRDSITDDELRSVKERSELLPDSVKKKVKDLEDAYQEGELTEKGYTKKLKSLLGPHLQKLQVSKIEPEGELYEPEVNTLPKFVIEQLEDIERELEEEEITPKGYKRKREKLLAPFMLKEPPFSSLPKSIQSDLNELAKEFEDGDLTEKGFKKRRSKVITPYLVKDRWPLEKQPWLTHTIT